MLKKRTAYLLKLLTHSGANPYGVKKSKVAALMVDVLGRLQPKGEGDTYETLRNYIKEERVPNGPYAWALGEALRKAGVPWMNGFCMLWTAGAFVEALATTFEYVVQHKNMLKGAEVDMLWYGSLGGMRLGEYRSAFDVEPEILQHTISDTGPTKDIAAFVESKIAARYADSFLIDSPDFDIDAYKRREEGYSISLRDSAMTRWHEVVPFMEPMESAFVAACIKNNGAYLPHHQRGRADVRGNSFSGVTPLVHYLTQLADLQLRCVGTRLSGAKMTRAA